MCVIFDTNHVPCSTDSRASNCGDFYLAILDDRFNELYSILLLDDVEDSDVKTTLSCSSEENLAFVSIRNYLYKIDLQNAALESLVLYSYKVCIL